MPGSFEVVPATLRSLDDQACDVLVLTAFSDERPLSGLSGLVDWRLGGVLSDWLINGFATGRANERVLYPSQGRLSQRFVLLMACPTSRRQSPRRGRGGRDSCGQPGLRLDGVWQFRPGQPLNSPRAKPP